MAADTIRGDGLFQAHRALAALAEDPEQFDQARQRRFSESPPSYRSRSGTTTRSDSPVPVDEALDAYNARKDKLYIGWQASTPAIQFEVQRGEEVDRIELAPVRVRERWIEQGIWDPKWYEASLERWGEGVQNCPLMGAQWMHEQPIESEDSGSDVDERSPENFKFGAKRKRQKTDEETRQSAERRQRRRELMRSIHQFNYRVSRERDRLLKERANEADHDDSMKRYPPDINTQAYTLVKDKWISKGLWFDKWGILPGVTRLHEHDIDELVQEELGPRPSPQSAVPAPIDFAAPVEVFTPTEALPAASQ